MADKNKETVEETKRAPEPERMVRVIIPKVKGDDSDEYISVNNRTWLIQRGKEIELPWSAYRQLKHKYHMEEVSEAYKAKVNKN